MQTSREQLIAELLSDAREVFGAEFTLERGTSGAPSVGAFTFVAESGRLTLTAPLEDGTTSVIGATVVEGATPWVSRLAREFLRRREGMSRFAELDEQLTASMSQISNDFEEQSYLRFLAEQIEICEVSRDVDPVMKKVLPRLRQVIHAETVVLVPPSRMEADGREDGRESGSLFRVGPSASSDDQCLHLVRTFREAAAIGPVVRNVGFSADEESLGPGVSNLLCVQMEKDSTRLGWLLALNCRATFLASHELQNGFGTVEAGLMQVTALMLATHARNVELFRETEALTVGVVRALVSAVEARDSYTRGHSERVALVAKRLAREYGLSEEQCERIYVAGLLHDVGKIGVADEVLQKPGKLSPEEFDEIKKHPDIGYSILMDLKRIEYLLPGVLYHHERVDGAGYPDGLAGDEIPLQARILAVADSWDAMTSARPYREPMNRAKVEQIIASGGGSQWDPSIVAAFLRIVDDVDEICRTHESAGLTMRRRRGVHAIPPPDGETGADPIELPESEEDAGRVEPALTS